ncbi:MAG: UbiX family flavin prenyltransferase [Desulfurococcaceae archaeon]
MSPRRVDYQRALVVALTGASGISLGIRLLRYGDLLRTLYSKVYALFSENAAKIAKVEENIELVSHLASMDIDAFYSEKDITAPLASSSNIVNTDMVIIPASLNTVAKVANSIQDNLIVRTACNVLRLKQKLIIVVRETPLSPLDLRNLYRLSLAGATIMPAVLAMYIRPRSIEEVMDFVVGKVLDALGIEHYIYRRWS